MDGGWAYSEVCCGLHRSLERSPMFQPAVIFKPQGGQVVPLRTLHQYRRDEEELCKQNELRGVGLSEQEIQLVLEGEREGGVHAEPSAVEERRRAIQEVTDTDMAVACLRDVCLLP